MPIDRWTREPRSVATRLRAQSLRLPVRCHCCMRLRGVVKNEDQRSASLRTCGGQLHRGTLRNDDGRPACATDHRPIGRFKASVASKSTKLQGLNDDGYATSCQDEKPPPCTARCHRD